MCLHLQALPTLLDEQLSDTVASEDHWWAIKKASMASTDFERSLMARQEAVTELASEWSL